MPNPISPFSSSQKHFIWDWLRSRFFPQGTGLVQWTSYVIILAVMIQYVLVPPEDVGPMQLYSAITALSGLLVINILWSDIEALFPKPQTGTWFLVLASAVLTFYIVGAAKMFNGIYALFMIAAQANAMLPPKPAVVFSILLFAAFLGLLTWMGLPMDVIGQTALGLMIGMTFTVTLMQVLRRYSEQTERANSLLAQLQKVNDELLAAREKEKELTIAEERVRVARDLHDGLGHHLTALSVQLQAAEKLVRANPEMSIESIRNARGEVQASLKEVRQSVAALRETPVDFRNLPGTIQKLVNETGQRSGLSTQFEQVGNAADLSTAVAMTIYRTVQEGLTNVQKHAQQAASVCVRLVFTTETVQVSIEDDGKGQPPCPDNTKGALNRFGLAGLRERAALLGGELLCGPRPAGGFFIRLSLPLKGDEA